jgi:hypothetical protein
MSDLPDARSGPSGRLILAGIAAAAIWGGCTLVAHPGFQPAYMLRMAAPVLALLLGAAVTHRVALLRRRVDVEGDVDAAGRALFLGVVMLAITLLCWLLAAHTLPATVTAFTGVARVEPGVVDARVALADDARCRFRLEVRSAATQGGSITRAMDECVAETLWSRVGAGDAVTLQLVGGALGAEIVGVGP